VVAVLVMATAACGSSDEGDDQQSTTEAWADDICSTVGAWKAVIAEAQATLSDTGNLSANAVHDAFSSVVTATDTFVTDLKDVGAPDTETGDEAEQQLSALYDQLVEQESIIEDATNQDSGTLNQLLAQVSIVTGALSTMITDAVAAVDNLRQLEGAAELENAFNSAPQCQDLQASESPSG
jgi:hypothetical protein